MAEGTSKEQKIQIVRDLAHKLEAALANVGDVAVDTEIVDYLAGIRNLPDVGTPACSCEVCNKPKVDEPKYKLPDPPGDNPPPEAVEQWFIKACFVIAEMLTEKRKAYGDNLSDTQKLLLIFYPEGIPPAAYAEVLVMVRIFDKFKRRANWHRTPDSWTDSENPWLDVAGYGVAILYDIMRGTIKE